MVKVKVRAKVKQVAQPPAEVIESFDADFCDDFGDDLDMDFGDDDFSFGNDSPSTEEWTAQKLASSYSTVPMEIADRVIEACQVSGVPVQYYIDRYCLHLHDATPMNNDFSSAYLNLMNRDRRNY